VSRGQIYPRQSVVEPRRAARSHGVPEGSETAVDRHESAQRLMETELEDVLGEDVTAEEARTAAERPRTVGTFLRENRLLIGILAATAAVLGAMLGLALGSAWFVVIALVVHLAGTYFVATFAIRLTSEVEKPDPVTVARLEAAGIGNPEAAINLAVRARGGTEAAEQAEEMTPASVPTELVGPGSPGGLRAG
jgi:hypothetical protein